MIDLDKYRWLRLEPIDAWFFRDGRPSNRGEQQSDLESEFPPHAPTVVGALRAGLARANGWSGRGSWTDQSPELKQVLGDGFDDLGQLQFLGPFLVQGNELVWPMPRHVVGRIVEVEDENRKPLRRFQAAALLSPSPEAGLSDAGPIRLPTIGRDSPSAADESVANRAGSKPPQPADGFFVTTSGLNQILAGQCPDVKETRHRDDLFVHESRVGIVREIETRTTGRNAMYSPRYVRLKLGVALIEAIAGLPNHWNVPALLPIGGESRMAAVGTLDAPPKFPQGPDGSSALAVSLAPIRFGDPWWGAGPGEDASRLSDQLSGTIASVALDRPQRIGGWNSLDGHPLPLKPFVPPGTVWWIESTDSIHGGLSQTGRDTAYGYGLIIVSANP